MKQRLQRFLAAAGVASRRNSEELIRSGQVFVDGRRAVIGESVDPDRQRVTVDGKDIVLEAKEYWLLNKPPGVVSTVRDPQGRRTVIEFVPSRARLFPVGRLDQDTSGVLLLTNDGELANRLIHPRYGVEKEYVVMVKGRPDERDVELLRRGVCLDGTMTAPAAVEVVQSESELTELRMTIHEGRKRQVKRMLEAVGLRVVRLHRVRFDGLDAADLAQGESRPLLAAEVERLRLAADSRRACEAAS